MPIDDSQFEIDTPRLSRYLRLRVLPFLPFLSVLSLPFVFLAREYSETWEDCLRFVPRLVCKETSYGSQVLDRPHNASDRRGHRHFEAQIDPVGSHY
jgi:hypothetical protein